MTTGLSAFLRKYFYLCMSLLIAVVVFYGFSHTINHNLLHASPIPPFILTIHAIVFPGWVLFFILQSSLVRTHNVRIHRTLGWFGVVLAVCIVVVGFLTVRGMDRFFIERFHDTDSPAFLVIQMTDLVCFPILFSLAIYWRRRPEYHRRLMLMAACILTDAAWARFPHMPLLGAVYCADGLIFLGILRDLIVDRKVNKVYLYAFPLMLCIHSFEMYTYFHASPWWIHIANMILR